MIKLVRKIAKSFKGKVLFLSLTLRSLDTQNRIADHIAAEIQISTNELQNTILASEKKLLLKMEGQNKRVHKNSRKE